jgi:hypothetical protein
MRTVVVVTLFFAFSLCVTLVPMFWRPQPTVDIAVGRSTYVVMIVPSIVACNAVFVFAVYYLPLRQLFYATERCLQRIARASRRAAGATSSPTSAVGIAPAAAHANDAPFGADERGGLASKMVDSDGSRGRGVQTLLDSVASCTQLRDVEEFCERGYALIDTADSLRAERRRLAAAAAAATASAAAAADGANDAMGLESPSSAVPVDGALFPAAPRDVSAHSPPENVSGAREATR